MVNNFVVKNSFNQPGQHNELSFPHPAPSRNQSIYLSDKPADSGQSSQQSAPTKAKGR